MCGMSADMAPQYLSMNPAGQMTYVLDTRNINLAQVQLAVPASEIVLIQQDENKTCDNSMLVAQENVGWLGNNVIVLVSQPQEFVMVEQEVVVDSNTAQTWQVEGSASTPLVQFVTKDVAAAESNPTQSWRVDGTSSATVVQIITKEDQDGGCEEETSTTTVEDAKCWFRDSLITTAALSTLTTYVQGNGSSKS